MTERLDDPQRADKPRCSYVPLSQETIEAWREHLLGIEQRPDESAEIDRLCDMAVNALLYAEEIERLRARSAGTRTTWAESVAFHTLLQGEGEAYEGPSSYGEALAAHIEECFKVASNNAFCIRREQAESVIAALRTPRSASERTDDYKALYHELLFAVGSKWPGETRHQTALRYIQRAETPSNEPAKESK